MGMNARGFPFLGFLGSFAKFQPNIGILIEDEHRIVVVIQKTNQTEPCFLTILKLYEQIIMGREGRDEREKQRQ